MSENEILYHPQIIPTVLIPLTALSVALSALATFVAALFGVSLKAEGPKKLLELLLKPRILIVAILSNLAIVGIIQGYQYYKNLPAFEFTIESRQKKLARFSDYAYPDIKEQAPTPALNDSKPLFSFDVSEKANQKMKLGSFRGAVTAGDRFFVGDDSGYLLEYSVASLEVIRKFYIGTKVSPAPVIYKNHIYVGEGTHDTHHARVYKFDLRTGLYVGALQTKGHTEGQAIIGEHAGRALLFAVAGSDGITAADPTTMKTVWHQNDGHVDAAVRVHDGLVFSGSGREKNDGKSYRAFASAYDFHSGERIWQRELPASSWMQPTVYKDNICFVFGEIYFKSNVGGFACYDQKTGTSRSSYMHFNPVVSPPLLLNDDFVIADFMGTLCRVSVRGGETRWCRETPQMKSSLAYAVYDDRLQVILYPTRKDGLFVLNPQTGEVLTQWKPSASEWKDTMAPVALSSAGWIVVDLEENIRLLAVTGSH